MKKTDSSVSRETLAQTLHSAIDEMRLTVTTAQADTLLDFVYLLDKWNATYNLTAIRNLSDMLVLHVLDSLAVQPWVKQTLESPAVLAPNAQPRLLDVGAGAGLPGLVLAILNPDWSITLVDAVQKKAAFMTQAIAQLKLPNAKAIHGRIEQVDLPPCDAVISRAFSDLDLFAKLASPHLSDRGVLMAMQGKADARVVAPFARQQLHRLTVPGLPATRHLLILDRQED